jgi:hypothetical protein
MLLVTRGVTTSSMSCADSCAGSGGGDRVTEEAGEAATAADPIMNVRDPEHSSMPSISAQSGQLSSLSRGMGPGVHGAAGDTIPPGDCGAC